MRTPPSASSQQAYVALLDWWLAAAGCLVIGLMLVGIVHVASAGMGAWPTAVGIALFFAGILYLVDTLFFTTYLLTAQALVVTSQLRRYVFPYRDMLKIRPAGISGLISFQGRKRFALSRAGFIISLRSGTWRTISVSPRSQEEFLDRMLRNIEGERSRRASVDERP